MNNTFCENKEKNHVRFEIHTINADIRQHKKHCSTARNDRHKKIQLTLKLLLGGKIFFYIYIQKQTNKQKLNKNIPLAM